MSNIDEIYINNFNHINFNNYPIIDFNETGTGWVIDRIPDYNLINMIHNRNEYDDINFINNIQNIRNQYFHEQFGHATQALMNGLLQFQHNIDNDDDLPADDDAANDDFIPFEPESQPINLIVEVHTFPVTEEEKDCCVCMESKEYQQICQLNCLHKFCSECTLTHIQRNTQQPCCPLCRTNITNISVQTQEIRDAFI
jgi:hypothetical protein